MISSSIIISQSAVIKFSVTVSGWRNFSWVLSVGTTEDINLSSQVFTTVKTALDIFRCTILPLYVLLVICYMMHRGHSSQLSSHLHFGQTSECGKTRSAKD